MNVGLRQRSQDAQVSSLGSGNMLLIHREKHRGNKVMRVCVCVCACERERERERETVWSNGRLNFKQVEFEILCSVSIF